VAEILNIGKKSILKEKPYSNFKTKISDIQSSRSGITTAVLEDYGIVDVTESTGLIRHCFQQAHWNVNNVDY
jgi:hypothetical protein